MHLRLPLTPVPPHLADGSSKHQGPVRQPGTAREHEGIGSQAVERQYIEHVHQHLGTHSQQDEQLPQMGLLRPPQVGAPGRIWPVSDPTQNGGSLYIPPCANCTSISFSYPPPHRHTEPRTLFLATVISDAMGMCFKLGPSEPA